MKQFFHRLWTEDRGSLSFEWVLLSSVLTIGAVGGISAARDAVIDEMGDTAQAMLSLDQSYTIDHPPHILVHRYSHSGAADSVFIDASNYTDCERGGPEGQTDSYYSEGVRVQEFYSRGAESDQPNDT